MATPRSWSMRMSGCSWLPLAWAMAARTRLIRFRSRPGRLAYRLTGRPPASDATMRRIRCSPPDSTQMVSSLIASWSSHHQPARSHGWIHGLPGLVKRPSAVRTSSSTAASNGCRPFAQARSPACVTVTVHPPDQRPAERVDHRPPVGDLHAQPSPRDWRGAARQHPSSPSRADATPGSSGGW